MKLDKIVELKLNDSHIEQLSKNTKVFITLTSINFEECQYLIKTPDFTGAPNLKIVSLKGCRRLHDIHPSLLLHKKITYLNLTRCTSLTTLSNKIHMKSLRRLFLAFCSKLKYFLEIVGSMEHLSGLDLRGTAIKELSSSIEFFIGLEWLTLDDCKNLVSLPIAINGLKSLEELSLSGCSKLENVPTTLLQVESLRRLYVRGTAIGQAMSSIFLMKKLNKLDFSGCKGPPSNSFSALFYKMSLMPIRNSNSTAFRLPFVSGLCTSLTTLSLSNCNLDEGAIPSDFFHSLSSLRELDLSTNNFVSLPRSINHLCNLRYLNLNSCTSLVTLSNSSGLWNLNLSNMSCINCLRLMGYNNMAFSMLKEHINKVQAVLKLGNKFFIFKWLKQLRVKSFGIFRMVAPGNKIPEWFSHQCEGSEIRIKRPLDLYNNSKFVGYVVCSVLSLQSCLYAYNVHYNVENNGKILGSPGGITNLRIDFDAEIGPAMSNHLGLLNFPRELFECNSVNYNGVRFLFRGHFKAVVIRCGVHPIYEEDVKDFSKINNQSICWNWNVFYQDDVVGSSKRKSCYDEGPKPKRFKLLNFF